MPTALGTHADANAGTVTEWPADDVRTGKSQVLNGASVIHTVTCIVRIVDQAVAVKVEASVNGKKYCRMVGPGGGESITHDLRMA